MPPTMLKVPVYGQEDHTLMLGVKPTPGHQLCLLPLALHLNSGMPLKHNCCASLMDTWGE